LSDQGFRLRRINFSPCPEIKKVLQSRTLSLSDQGSNLDFTDPESVVLPITPSDNGGAKVKIFIYPAAIF
jgi:hypothetical protein